jgi:hypothetical protein
MSIKQISATTERNLVICIFQLLITQGLSMCYFAFTPELSERFQVPIIFGYAAPLYLAMPGFSFHGPPIPTTKEYLVLYSVIAVVDLVFLSVMTWSISRNHKIVSCVCLLLFNLLGIGMTAAAAV